MTLTAIEDANFLDKRMNADWNSAVEISASDITLPAMGSSPALLFHTAFCGSTLLARALHAGATAVSLKEPLVLHALADARLHTRSESRRHLLDDDLRTALSLLARPWAMGGRVLIKPSNQVNTALHPMLAAAPAARCILLYSDLREFMVSCFKKLPEAEQRIRWMAQALIRDTKLRIRLAIDPSAKFNLVESCVLAWFAQIELFADALTTDTVDRLRSLDMQRMLADPQRSVLACAQWLKLETDSLTSRIDSAFAQDSKTPARSFGSVERELQKEHVLAAYGEIIDSGIAWAESVVAPHAVRPLDWKPLVIA